MKNKGFTLIELLAVIVILAIIALIATPIILGIINDARTEAKKRSAELAYSGVEYAVTSYMFEHSGNVPGTVNDLKDHFRADNVTFTVSGDTATITDKANNKLCTVTYVAGENGKEAAFKVTCEGLMDEKLITVGTSK